MDEATSLFQASQPAAVAAKASAADAGSAPSQKEERRTEGQAGGAAQESDDNGEFDCEPFDLESYKPASADILAKLLAQAEFYFSDSNVLKDKFLLKNIQTNKGAFVSLKLLSSFRRMQATSKDWRDLAYALRNSEKLELNAAGNKVRRRDPLPQWDDGVFDRTVVATKLQLPEVSVNAVKSIFGKCGSVTLVRVLQPGKNLPEDLQQFASKHPELSSRVCALIEFSKEDEALQAIKELDGKGDWRAMQVTRLRDDLSNEFYMNVTTKGDGAKIVHAGSKGKENVGGRNVVMVDSSPSSSPSTRRKKKTSRSGTTGSVPIPDRHRLEALGSPGWHSRSPGGDRRSPKPSSFTGSGDDAGYDRFDSRTTPKPIPGRMQQHRGTPHGSPDTRRRGAEESPLSCSPASLGSSPWIRRKALMEQSDPSSSPGRNLIAVTRQPRGPDGSKGFMFPRPRS